MAMTVAEQRALLSLQEDEKPYKMLHKRVVNQYADLVRTIMNDYDDAVRSHDIPPFMEIHIASVADFSELRAKALRLPGEPLPSTLMCDHFATEDDHHALQEAMEKIVQERIYPDTLPPDEIPMKTREERREVGQQVKVLTDARDAFKVKSDLATDNLMDAQRVMHTSQWVKKIAGRQDAARSNDKGQTKN